MAPGPGVSKKCSAQNKTFKHKSFYILETVALLYFIPVLETAVFYILFTCIIFYLHVLETTDLLYSIFSYIRN